MKILNQTQGVHLATQVRLADSFCSRLVGLLNRSGLNEDEGLLITRCQSIHMFFMRFAIDVVFVNQHHTVVGLVSNIKPFQISPLFVKANYAIELKSGIIQKTNTTIGDLLIKIND